MTERNLITVEDMSGANQCAYAVARLNSSFWNDAEARVQGAIRKAIAGKDGKAADVSAAQIKDYKNANEDEVLETKVGFFNNLATSFRAGELVYGERGEGETLSEKAARMTLATISEKHGLTLLKTGKGSAEYNSGVVSAFLEGLEGKFAKFRPIFDAHLAEIKAPKTKVEVASLDALDGLDEAAAAEPEGERHSRRNRHQEAAN